MTRFSRDTGRQVGVVVDRKGAVVHVIVGDELGIVIPDLSAHGLGRGKLRGLRCVHTHLHDEPLTEDDLADLALLRLDAIAAVGVTADGRPATFRAAHLLPPNPEGEAWRVLPPAPFHGFDLPFGPFVASLEDEIASKQGRARAVGGAGGDRAILVHVSRLPRHAVDERVRELEELCRTAGVEALDVVVQRPGRVNPRTLLGRGKLRQTVASALQKGADLLIFDQELTPAQSRAIAEAADVRVVDRTQLILDIFARRAHTPDGKVQVELAQLRYILPRLTGRGTAMSRLMGGIGGRGPGETKLEVDRRRVRDRISHLERRLQALSRGRTQRRSRRIRSGVPIVSIVGYTNAGKSTLLNALTRSEVLTEDLLFATLDTTSRRLRFPREREVIVTDTVGFLRDLPKGLLGAFRATLEELQDADLLLHLCDASSPALEEHLVAVDRLLRDLDLGDKPVLRVFNKVDLLPPLEGATLARRHGGIALSARDPATFGRLMAALEHRLWPAGGDDRLKGTAAPAEP